MLQEICEKSIPVLPNALAHADAAFYRNGRVQQYVPQVLGTYDDALAVAQSTLFTEESCKLKRCKEERGIFYGRDKHFSGA